MSYEVILYKMSDPEKVLIVAKRGTVAECRTAMRQFAGKGWTMERRPDIHTWGDLVLRFRKEGDE